MNSNIKNFWSLLSEKSENVFELLWQSRYKLTLGASLALATYFASKKFFKPVKGKSQKQKNKPPGPEPSDENLGNMGDMMKEGSLFEYLLKVHTEFSSEIVSFWFGKTLSYSICSPDLFKSCKHLSDRPLELLGMFGYLLTDRTMILANGEEGISRRRAYDKNFAHSELLKMLPDMNEAGNNFLRRIKKYDKSNESVSLRELIVFSAIEAFAPNVFGDFFQKEEDYQELLDCYEPLWDDLELSIVQGTPVPGSEREKKYKENHGKFRKLVENAVEDRKKKRSEGEIVDPNLFIDTLIDYWGDDKDAIYADAAMYMIASVHTTGYTLIFAFYYIALFPEFQEKIAKEVLEVVGKDGLTSMSFEQISNLHKTRAFLHETFRLTTTQTMRSTTEEMDIGGFKIPAKSPVYLSTGVSFMNPEVYPNPREFNPTRFYDQVTGKSTGFQFSIFGFAGKRSCPGQKLANQEVTMWFGKWLASGMRVKIDEEKTGKVEKNYGFATTPKSPIYFFISFEE